jgi:hypothetical protein
MALHELSAWEHIDRIESMVYDAVYSDRRPPDPSQVPTSSKLIPSSAAGGSSSVGESPRSQEKAQPPKRGGLSFVDGN